MVERKRDEDRRTLGSMRIYGPLGKLQVGVNVVQTLFKDQLQLHSAYVLEAHEEVTTVEPK